MNLPLTHQRLEADNALENGTLAQVLRGVADRLMGTTALQSAAPTQELTLSKVARSVLRHRRRREDLFPDLFADPAWDVLLDLFAAQREGKAISISSACIAARVPSTTALRCIHNLVTKGFIVRANDPSDARRVHLRLTEVAERPLEKWLIEAALGYDPHQLPSVFGRRN